ncbi:phage portal protein [Escherichia coli]|uniref:phage portal protein n=1 Tax=Escherichia coli TaxID=562 RepID=UPI0024E01561|nr:phage portal protein [Escherichia coli]
MDFRRLNRRCCGISPPVLAFPTNSLSRDYSKVSYSSARASANESWRYFMGRRKFIAARLATQMFSYWLEEALLRGIIRPPRARFDFYQARSAGHGQSGLVPEEWPLTGSRRFRNR